MTWPQQIKADLIKTAMARLDRIFRRRNMKARIVDCIHDSVWVETAVALEPAVGKITEGAMTTTMSLSVPLAVHFEE